MIAFIENNDTCRNILLAGYFGEVIKQSCGRCDICLQHKRRQSNQHYRKDIFDALLRQHSISLQDLSGKFPHIAMSTIIDYIRTLSDEQLCRIDSMGIITVTDKTGKI